MSTHDGPASALHAQGVHAFRALRYAAGGDHLARLTIAPPDHWDDEHITALMDRDEHNVVHLLVPVLAGDGDASRAPEIAARLQRWIGAGILAVDPSPAMYVYRYADGAQTLRALVAAVSLGASGVSFLPHENLIEAVADRQRSLLHATHAQLEPVLALHHGNPEVASVLDATVCTEPLLLSVTEDGARHELWAITDHECHQQVSRALATDRLLIADGHHRYAALASDREHRLAVGRPTAAAWDSVVAMLVDADEGGLQLGAIHRVIPGLTWRALDDLPLPGVPVASFTEAVHHLADRADHSRWVVTDGTNWRTGQLGGQLAVGALHDRWIPRWGVDDQTVQYVHDAELAVGVAVRTHGLAVLLPVIDLEHVFAAAERRHLMPRKATSFGPKPRIGMLMRDLDAD